MKVLFYYIDSQSSSGYSTGLGIASISGYLKRHGVQTDLVYFKNQADLQYAINKTKVFSPDIIGFYSTASGWPLVNRLSKELRNLFPNIFQAYGGIHSTLTPGLLYDAESLDAVCVGYGEEPMLKLCQSLEINKLPEGISGLWVRKGHSSKIEETKPFFPETNHDDFLYFDHNLFLNELQRFQGFHKNSYVLEIIFNRGCPFRCSFCSNHRLNKVLGNRFFQPSPQASIEAIKRGISETGLKKIEIHDDILTLNKKWFRSFITMYAEQIGLPFVCNLRANTFDEDDVKLLKKANIQTAWIGIESGSDYVRNEIMQKGVSREAIIESIRLLHKYEISVITQNIIGVPGETPDHFLDTIRINAQANPTNSFLSIFFPYPGTELGDMCVSEGLIAHPEAMLQERSTTILNMPNFPPDNIQFYYENYETLIQYEQIRLLNPQQNLPPLNVQDISKIVDFVKKMPVAQVKSIISSAKAKVIPNIVQKQHEAPVIAKPSNDNVIPAKLEPASRVFGLDRGMPIDRYYIENYLRANASVIRGCVLEIADNTYTKKFGTGVTQSEVLNAVPSNVATIVGDMATGENIPEAAFDCIIMTQTIQCIYDVRSALKNAVKALKPGGTLLLTAPGISQISRYDMDRWGDYWRFTDKSLKTLLSESVSEDMIDIQAHGNVTVAKAFLDGLAYEELDQQTIDYRDEDYQVLLTAKVCKPAPKIKESVANTCQRAMSQLASTAPIILIYHRVADDPIDSQLLAVSPEYFEGHLKELADKYRVVPLRQILAEALSSSISPNTVALTFDDGYADNLINALPLLEKYGLHATIFVTSGMVGSDREFWWDALERIFVTAPSLPSDLKVAWSGGTFDLGLTTPQEKLKAMDELGAFLREQPHEEIAPFIDALYDWAGLTTKQARPSHLIVNNEQLNQLAASPSIEIGSHTITHTKLSSLSPQKQRYEIRHSREQLENIIKKPVRLLSYPFGAKGDYTNETMSISAEEGYEAGIANIQGTIKPPIDMYAVPRILVRNWSRKQFAAWLSDSCNNRLEVGTLAGRPEKIMSNMTVSA